jgi:hypothetical protein
LRFLIEQVGQVKGVYPAEKQLSMDSCSAVLLVTEANCSGYWHSAILQYRSWPDWPTLAALAGFSSGK